MATNQIAVLGQYQACALRRLKLDASWRPLGTGPNNVVVTTAIGRANLTPRSRPAPRSKLRPRW